MYTTCSMRPRIRQLVTMICTNSAMRSYTSKAYACMVRLAKVVKVAINSTKQGRRRSRGITWRKAEANVAEPISTRVVAAASPSALATVVDTASSGHNPSSCTGAIAGRAAALAG